MHNMRSGSTVASPAPRQGSGHASAQAQGVDAGGAGSGFARSGHPLLRAGAVLLGYALAVVVFSWPLALHITDGAVLARGSDFYPHIWNLWWVRFALLDLHQNPYHTTYLNYPTGMPLVFHVLDPLDGLVSIPLQGAVGLLAAFNLLRLAQVMFAATACYALLRTLRLPPLASGVGGALFAFCPLMGTAMDLGQLVEISTGWIPLYILLLVRGLGNRQQGIQAGRLWWAVAAGLALAASALSTWYFFISLVLFTVLYVLWQGLSASPGRSILAGMRDPTARAALTGLVALAVLSPLIAALFRERASGVEMDTPLRTVVLNSADLLAFFLPMPAHYTNPAINPHGNNPALGWTALALAIVGLVAGGNRNQSRDTPPGMTRRALGFWAVVAGVFALLALGPHLLVAGHDTGIPMPYQLLSDLPFLGVARVPLRFALMVSLALAVLAAQGLAVLAARARVRAYHPLAQAGLLAVLALLAGIELFNVPRTLIAPQAHPFFEGIAAHGSEGAHDAVLELPYGQRTAPAMFDQTVHQRPIPGGYTARHYPYPWISSTPGVTQLVQADADALTQQDIIWPPPGQTALQALDYFGVRYVAVYNTADEQQAHRLEAVVDALFRAHGITPVYEDPAVAIYEVPRQRSGSLIVAPAEGWYDVERQGNRVWRWTGGQAALKVINPSDSTVSARLTLTVYAVSTPRTLLVSLDGQQLASEQVGPHPGRTVEIRISIAPGEHLLTLASTQPPEQVPGDNRALALGYQKVELLAAPPH